MNLKGLYIHKATTNNEKKMKRQKNYNTLSYQIFKFNPKAWDKIEQIDIQLNSRRSERVLMWKEKESRKLIKDSA